MDIVGLWRDKIFCWPVFCGIKTLLVIISIISRCNYVLNRLRGYQGSQWGICPSFSKDNSKLRTKIMRSLLYLNLRDDYFYCQAIDTLLSSHQHPYCMCNYHWMLCSLGIISSKNKRNNHPRGLIPTNLCYTGCTISIAVHSIVLSPIDTLDNRGHYIWTVLGVYLVLNEFSQFDLYGDDCTCTCSVKFTNNLVEGWTFPTHIEHIALFFSLSEIWKKHFFFCFASWGKRAEKVQGKIFFFLCKCGQFCLHFPGVEFCKGARQSDLVSVWQHTLVGQRWQGFLHVSGSSSVAPAKLFCWLGVYFRYSLPLP